MDTTPRTGTVRWTTVRTGTVRWIARILSLPIVLIWVFFIVAYAIGPERSLPGNLQDGIAYTAMVISLLGLAVAWKWELTGAAVTLVTVAIGAIINWTVLLSLSIVIPFDAVLFLVSWWMARNERRRDAL